MSVVESQSDMAQEVADRLLDQSPAWGLPRIFSGLNLQAMLHDARQRVHDSHRLQMKTLGGEASELDEMGNTIIARDVTVNQPAPAKKIGSALLAAASVAMGLAGGAAGLAVLQWWLDRPEIPAVQPADPSDWQLGIEVKTEP